MKYDNTVLRVRMLGATIATSLALAGGTAVGALAGFAAGVHSDLHPSPEASLMVGSEGPVETGGAICESAGPLGAECPVGNFAFPEYANVITDPGPEGTPSVWPSKPAMAYPEYADVIADPGPAEPAVTPTTIASGRLPFTPYADVVDPPAGAQPWARPHPETATLAAAPRTDLGVESGLASDWPTF